MFMSKINHTFKTLPQLQILQIIRIIAAMSIALAHINRITQIHFNRNLGFVPAVFGDWGIDLFFVLSGFIIFYVHSDDFAKPQIVKSYLIKRFIRIYPIYWILTLVIIPVIFIFPDIGGGYERDFEYIVKSFLLIPQAYSPLLFLGWTLIHIIRFYLFIALMIWLKKNLGIILMVTFILFTLLLFIAPKELDNPLTNYLFSPFNIEFLLGFFGAYIMKLSKNTLQRTYILTSLVIYLILFLTFFPYILNKITDPQILLQSFNNPLMIRERVWLLGIPFAIIITSLGIFEKKYSLKLPGIFLYLGDASYSIYLSHYMFIYIFILMLTASGLSASNYLSLIMSIVFLLSIGGGCIFYSVLEKPLLKFLKAKTLSI